MDNPIEDTILDGWEIRNDEDNYGQNFIELEPIQWHIILYNAAPIILTQNTIVMGVKFTLETLADLSSIRSWWSRSITANTIYV